jgi:hypothetical protein
MRCGQGSRRIDIFYPADLIERVRSEPAKRYLGRYKDTNIARWKDESRKTNASLRWRSSFLPRDRRAISRS